MLALAGREAVEGKGGAVTERCVLCRWAAKSRVRHPGPEVLEPKAIATNR